MDKAVVSFKDPSNGFEIKTFHGLFENAVDQIMAFVESSFSLIFIDPTGWTGYPYNKIAPVLRHQRGEVLINFMYDHINRFAASNDPTIVTSLAPILGGADWPDKLDSALPRGEAIEKLFRETLKQAGCFDFVLSTRIDKPTADRPHFFIAYGTRHEKGVAVFRDVEHRALQSHEKRRNEAKERKRAERTGMDDLFANHELPEPASSERALDDMRMRAKNWVIQSIKAKGPTEFKNV